MKELINKTNELISNWYKNALIDYNVVGSGEAKIEGDRFIINYVENGEEKEWSTSFYPEYVNLGLDYFYNVWAENA